MQTYPFIHPSIHPTIHPPGISSSWNLLEIHLKYDDERTHPSETPKVIDRHNFSIQTWNAKISSSFIFFLHLQSSFCQTNIFECKELWKKFEKMILHDIQIFQKKIQKWKIHVFTNELIYWHKMNYKKILQCNDNNSDLKWRFQMDLEKNNANLQITSNRFSVDQFDYIYLIKFWLTTEYNRMVF